MAKRKYSLEFIAFFQALGLILYCGLVALLIANGNQIFGMMPNYFGPLLFLILFSSSALICGLITLGYPFILFWQKKEPMQALRLVIYTTGWSMGSTLLILLSSGRAAA
jgi:hypothetical protein